MAPSYAFRSVASVAALALLAACQDSSTSAPDVSPSFARSEPAQQRLAQLFPETSAEVLDLEGTVYADHNEQSGKLEFGVERAELSRGVAARLRARGLADSDYEIRVVPAIRNMATLRDVNEAQARAGTQIHFGNYVCTLGFNIEFGSNDGFITNSHCTNTQGGVESTTYHLPVRVGSAPAEAIEVQDPTYVRNIAGCSKGKRCRRSDASRAVYQTAATGTSGALGQIAAPLAVNTGDLTIGQTFNITSVNSTQDVFASNTELHKVGRTTGWTSGRVTGTCVNVNVSGTSLQQLCQTLVENTGATIVSGGDSGSPVFLKTGSTSVTLVGILWGGGGTSLFVFSPLKNVRAEIGGSWTAN